MTYSNSSIPPFRLSVKCIQPQPATARLSVYLSVFVCLSSTPLSVSVCLSASYPVHQYPPNKIPLIAFNQVLRYASTLTKEHVEYCVRRKRKQESDVLRDKKKKDGHMYHRAPKTKVKGGRNWLK